MPIRLDLGGLEDEQKIGLARRHHRAENALAKSDIARDGPPPLAHAFDFAFLHIQTGAQGDVGENVSAFEDTLAT